MRIALLLTIASLSAACFRSTYPTGPREPTVLLSSRYRGENPVRVLLDDDDAYVLDSEAFDGPSGIRRVARGGGGETEVIRNMMGSGTSAVGFAVDRKYVFWTARQTAEEHAHVLRAKKKVDAEVDAIAEIPGTPGALAIVGSDVYFAVGGSEAGIYVVPKGGGDSRRIVELPYDSKVTDLILVGDKLVGCDSELGRVFETTLDGQLRELMKMHNAEKLAVYEGRIVLSGLGGLYDVASGRQLVDPGDDIVRGVAPAPEGIYFGIDKTLRLLPWNGGPARVVARLEHEEIEDVIVADEGLYFVDSDSLWFRARER